MIQVGTTDQLGEAREQTLADPVLSVLGILVVLQIKHFICDYPLQTSYQLNNKGTYLHAGGILHAGLHALFTTSAFLIVPPAFALGCGIVFGEFLLHYHIDWAKEQLVRHMGWQPNQHPFWWLIGADQMLHHFTYIAIAAILVGVIGF